MDAGDAEDVRYGEDDEDVKDVGVGEDVLGLMSRVIEVFCVTTLALVIESVTEVALRYTSV